VPTHRRSTVRRPAGSTRTSRRRSGSRLKSRRESTGGVGRYPQVGRKYRLARGDASRSPTSHRSRRRCTRHPGADSRSREGHPIREHRRRGSARIVNDSARGDVRAVHPSGCSTRQRAARKGVRPSGPGSERRAAADDNDAGPSWARAMEWTAEAELLTPYAVSSRRCACTRRGPQ